MARKAKGEGVKTTVRLNADLWKKARIRALDERISFQILVERAIAQYLKSRSR